MLPALIAAAPSIIGALKPAPAGPAKSESFTPWTQGDWVVATGGSQASESRDSGLSPLMLLAAAALVGLLMWRKYG